MLSTMQRFASGQDVTFSFLVPRMRANSDMEDHKSKVIVEFIICLSLCNIFYNENKDRCCGSKTQSKRLENSRLGKTKPSSFVWLQLNLLKASVKSLPDRCLIGTKECHHIKGFTWEVLKIQT